MLNNPILFLAVLILSSVTSTTHAALTVQINEKCSGETVTVSYDDSNKTTITPNVFLNPWMRGGDCEESFEKSLKKKLKIQKFLRCTFSSKNSFCDKTSSEHVTAASQIIRSPQLRKAARKPVQAAKVENTNPSTTVRPGVDLQNFVAQNLAEESKSTKEKVVKKGLGFLNGVKKKLEKVYEDNIKPTILPDSTPPKTTTDTEVITPEEPVCEDEETKGPTGIAGLLQKIKDYSNKDNCAELKPGEFKLQPKDSNNGSAGNFLLSRTGENSYQAVLNMNFSKQGVPQPQILANVKECMVTASKYLKGPNGETLEVVVMDDAESDSLLPNNQRPPKKNIEVDGNSYASSENFLSSFNCPTITHEILHHLGLCDEYQEDRDFRKAQWNCRIVPKENTIMKDHIQGFNKVVPRTVTCECKSKECKSTMSSLNVIAKSFYKKRPLFQLMKKEILYDKYCKLGWSDPKNINVNTPSQILNSSTATTLNMDYIAIAATPTAPFFHLFRANLSCTCPPGVKECTDEIERVVANINIQEEPKYCPYGSEMSDTTYDSNVPQVTDPNKFTLKMSGDSGSLLPPNHFNKIIEGGCRNGKSETYQKCASFAYEGQIDKNLCMAPPECFDDKYYLGTSQ